MNHFPHVAGRIFDTPLMVHPGKAAAIANAIGPRVLQAQIGVTGPEIIEHVAGGNSLMGRLGDPLETRIDDREALFRRGPIAIIPIEGTLVHKGKWVGASSGETSYEGIFRRVIAARRDPSVRGVVIEVDSYGGEVAGAFDVADEIHALAMEKPTIAILTDFAYSAGYLLAAAARSIIIPQSGGAGSIGVIAMHADFSKMLEKGGITVSIVTAGEHKADGNPYQPLPSSVAAKWQKELQGVRQQFTSTVGKYRGKRLDAAAALATEAECYRGEEAVTAGLADAVARPSEAFEAFAAQVQGHPVRT